MAEIKVEKKKPIWPWIVGILAVLLIIFLLFMFMDDEGTDEDIEERDQQVEEAIDPYEETTDGRDYDYPQNAIGQYLYYVEEEYEEREIEENQEYPQEAMHKLAAAVEEKIRDHKDEPNQELEELVDSDTAATAQNQMSVEEIEEKGRIVLDGFIHLQEIFYEDLDDEIQELQSDFQEIAQTMEGEERAEAVTGFYRQAAEVLREMSGRESGATMERSQPVDTAQFSTEVDTIEGNDN